MASYFRRLTRIYWLYILFFYTSKWKNNLISFTTIAACFFVLRPILLGELIGTENVNNGLGFSLWFSGLASFIGLPLTGIPSHFHISTHFNSRLAATSLQAFYMTLLEVSIFRFILREVLFSYPLFSAIRSTGSTADGSGRIAALLLQRYPQSDEMIRCKV